MTPTAATILRTGDGVRTAQRIHKLLIKHGQLTYGDLDTLLKMPTTEIHRGVQVLRTGGMARCFNSTFGLRMVELSPEEVERLRQEAERKNVAKKIS